MTTHKEALTLALEALETCYSSETSMYRNFDKEKTDNAITTIKEALAQQEQCTYPNCDYPCMNLPDCKESEQESDDLTIAYMAGLSRGKDLAPQRKPLTDEQRRETINSAWSEYLRGEGHDSFGWYLSQAIEAAHGIKVEA